MQRGIVCRRDILNCAKLLGGGNLTRSQEAKLYIALASHGVDTQEYYEAITHSLRAINSSRGKRNTRQAATLLYVAETHRLQHIVGLPEKFALDEAKRNVSAYIEQGCPRITQRKRDHIDKQLKQLRPQPAERVKEKLFAIFDNGTRRLLNANSERVVTGTSHTEAIPTQYKVHFIQERGEDRISISCQSGGESGTHPLVENIDSAGVTLTRTEQGFVWVEDTANSLSRVIFEHTPIPGDLVSPVESALGIIEAAVGH